MTFESGLHLVPPLTPSLTLRRLNNTGTLAITAFTPTKTTQNHCCGHYVSSISHTAQSRAQLLLATPSATFGLTIILGPFPLLILIWAFLTSQNTIFKMKDQGSRGKKSISERLTLFYPFEYTTIERRHFRSTRGHPIPLQHRIPRQERYQILSRWQKKQISLPIGRKGRVNNLFLPIDV